MSNFFCIFGTVFCTIGGVLWALIAVATLATWVGKAFTRCYWRWYNVEREFVAIRAFVRYRAEFMKWYEENKQ